MADQRLLAEALAASPRPQHEGALATARRTQGGLEAKILAYHRALPDAGPMDNALHTVRRVLAACIALALILAFLAGAATLRTAFATDGGISINFHWAVLSVLGLNTLLLALWLVMLLLARNAAANNSLGAAVLGLWRFLAARLTSDRGTTGLAAGAVVRRLGRARFWAVSALSHMIWLAFLCGALAMAVILLATRQYAFHWETTILAAESYVALTDALASLPRALGLNVPDAAAITAARWQGEAAGLPGDQTGWSALFLACLILYGILPRLLCALVGIWRTRRTVLHSALDLAEPGFAALVPQLAPVVEQTRIVSPAPETPARPHYDDKLAIADIGRPKGAVAILGWETDAADAIDGEGPTNLGMVDSAASLNTALDRLTSLRPADRIVIIANLATTPDRGVTAGLKRITALGTEVVLLLTGASETTRRLGPEDAGHRLTDWVSVAHAAGIALGHIAEIDLTPPTAESRRRVADIIGVDR